jgi:hypothetical protein
MPILSVEKGVDNRVELSPILILATSMLRKLLS